MRSLASYVAKLKLLQPTSADFWDEDFANYWAVLHGLQLAAQHVIDIANHILAAQSLAAPSDYKEAIVELGRNHILPMDFATQISEMAGFRNVVVHRYLTVDPLRVLNILQNHLDDFNVFSEHIYDYLRREGHLPQSESKPE